MASIERRLRDGQSTWRAHYRTPSGAQRNKTFPRKIDAERFLAGVEHSKAAGSYVDPALSRVTLGDWAERWLAGQAHIKPTTHARYAGILRKHVHPTWGHLSLASVAHADVQAWVTELTREHSPATVQKIHRVLSQVLDLAVKDGRLARNVATGVNLPRVIKHEHHYLSHEQVEDLAHECGSPSEPSKHATYDTRTNTTYRLVVLFLAYTGARFGEMAALKVARLDLRRNRAIIAESVTPIAGQGMVWGTPKTHQRREVPIPTFLAIELAAHVAGAPPDALVFASIRTGEPLRVSTFRQAFGVAATTIGRPDQHPHELRHTSASLAIASGADVKVVQQMLGHASAAMTVDTYGHLRTVSTRSATLGRRTPSLQERRQHAGAALPSVARAASTRKRTRGPVLRVRRSGPLEACTPDRIRTGATAVRGRRARPLHNGGLSDAGWCCLRLPRLGQPGRV